MPTGTYAIYRETPNGLEMRDEFNYYRFQPFTIQDVIRDFFRDCPQARGKGYHIAPMVRKGRFSVGPGEPIPMDPETETAHAAAGRLGYW